jgi:hypothetical protein
MHDYTLTWEEWDDLYSTEFTSNRRGIFHYCVMAHKDGTGSGILGEGYPGGDTFVLYDANLGGDWWPGGFSHEHKQADIFMHELGHNILGSGTADHPYGWHRDGDGHCSHEGCSMYATGIQDIKYCSYCWDDIDLPWSLV